MSSGAPVEPHSETHVFHLCAGVRHRLTGAEVICIRELQFQLRVREENRHPICGGRSRNFRRDGDPREW